MQNIDLQTTEPMDTLESVQFDLKRLSMIYDTIGDLVYDIEVGADGNYYFNWVNKAFSDIAGLRKDKIIGRKVSELIPQSALPAILKKYIHAINTKKFTRWEESIDFEDTHMVAEITIIPVFDENGTCTNLVGSFHDITERKKSEKTLSMLAQAIRSVSECVSITDLSDRIIFVNNAFLKTYQYEEHELLGQHISMVRSIKNPVDHIKEILPATLKGGWHGELINTKKDGSEFPVFISTSVIFDENNYPLGLIGVSTDITDRKHAEHKLQESEARNKALFSAIPDLMFMFDREGNFTDFHVQDPKNLLVLPSNFLNRNVYDVLPHELALQTMEHLKEVFKTGKTTLYEYTLPVGEDTGIYESRIVPCGKDRALSIVRDITDQKKMESQMILSERLAALGEMLAGMAHEINQPLNTLSMLFDNILFEAHEYHTVSESYLVSKSEKIFNNILRIRNIIDHVREFSREQEQEESLPFSINESITNAISMVSEQFRMAGIELKSACDEHLPMVTGNTYKFERIILNLLNNSKDGLIQKREELKDPFPMFIKLNTSLNRQKLHIEVTDNGCGIRQEHLSKVFQPFYTSKETGKGTGLGLSISYGLIKEMNGSIDIQSEVMKGTTVTITIPCQP